jgi:hydrogenase maturation protease
VAISNANGSGVLVIGVGNENRGDDAVGLTVSRQLREKLPHDAMVAEETGDGARLMELWKGFDVVVLIDAVKSGAGPGTIHMFEAHKSPLPTALLREEYSTHAFGIPQAIELARAMNQLPRRLLVYGIEGECFDEGAHMSPTIERAARQLVELLTFGMLQQPEGRGLGN